MEFLKNKSLLILKPNSRSKFWRNPWNNFGKNEDFSNESLDKLTGGSYEVFWKDSPEKNLKEPLEEFLKKTLKNNGNFLKKKCKKKFLEEFLKISEKIHGRCSKALTMKPRKTSRKELLGDFLKDPRSNFGRNSRKILKIISYINFKGNL